MLWLCLHLPHLPLSALGAPDQAPIVDRHGAHRWLITGTERVPAGTSLAQALVIEPALCVRPRRPHAEQAALTHLAYAAYAYGQPVCAEIQDLHEPGRLPRALLWVEIGQSLALFGGIGPLRDALCRDLLDLGCAAQLGMAPTRAAAALLACADTDPRNSTSAQVAQERPAPAPASLRSGTVSRACADTASCDSKGVREAQALRTRIESLPLCLLHWPGETLDALRGVGFDRLGDLFAVPREAFSKRFGTGYRLALDRLLGDAPEPFDAIVPPETFRRRFELPAEIGDTERLQFPLKRLCTELQSYLRARDIGLRSVMLAVLHAGARQTRVHAQFVDPHRDAKRIFDALHERLHNKGLPLPARELILVAEDFAAASVPQSDLFDPRAGHAQAWMAALERIRGRLGESRAWTVQAAEDHRPERGVLRALTAERNPGFRPAPQDRRRPTFLLPEPWPMPAPPLPPGTQLERIETGWWDAGDVQRDYAVVEINGARAWVFRDRLTQQWHLHGWFA